MTEQTFRYDLLTIIVLEVYSIIQSMRHPCINTYRVAHLLNQQNDRRFPKKYNNHSIRVHPSSIKGYLSLASTVSPNR